VKDRVPRLEPFWPLLVLHLADRRRENGCTSIMIRGLWAGKGHRYGDSRNGSENIRARSWRWLDKMLNRSKA